MLVLSREKGESIVIDLGSELVIINISDIKGDLVKLGIEAPRHIRVDRQEIFNKRCREQERSK